MMSPVQIQIVLLRYLFYSSEKQRKTIISILFHFQGVISHAQMESLTDKALMEKHRIFRLNTGKCTSESHTRRLLIYDIFVSFDLTQINSYARQISVQLLHKDVMML